MKPSHNRSDHTVIVVPGLGDKKESSLVKKWWESRGIKVVWFESGWKNNENYEKKLDRLVELIENESKMNPVSLIGTSAGGSLVINAFRERKDRVSKVITVCARLRKGQIGGFRGFEDRTKGYAAFRESIEAAQKYETSFSLGDRRRIMTIHAQFGDELVPTDTATIAGATNITVPTGGHMLGIASSLTIFSKPLVGFILEK